MEETFSYEDIYELLRVERASSDLQLMDIKDLAKIRDYIKAKKDLLDKQDSSTSIFSSQKRAKIQLEIDNALRALRDLYERRERKVINRAILSIRTDSKLKDTSNMLESEEKLHNILLTVLQDSKDKFLNLIESKEEIILKKTPESEEEVLTNKMEEVKESISEPSQETPEEIAATNLVRIKFIEDVPELMGSDLKKYGPFTKDLVSEVPEELAKLIISQNKAEEVKEVSEQPSQSF